MTTRFKAGSMKSTQLDRNSMSLPKAGPTRTDKTWQQTKSENTRMTILDAALDCFYELGYGNTTTEKVAKRAGVSRGAMLHHFPSRKDLIRASVMHLNQKRLALYEETELRVNEGAQHTRIGEGIDAFWEQLKSPLFVVLHELRVAARTDEDLREVLDSAAQEIDESWNRVTSSVFPDLALSEKFLLANLVSQSLLEGLVTGGNTEGEVPRRVISWLKERLVEMFADVRGVDRETASRQVRGE